MRRTIPAVAAVALAAAAMSQPAAAQSVGKALYATDFEYPAYKIGPLAGQDQWAAANQTVPLEAAQIVPSGPKNQAAAFYAKMLRAPISGIPEWSRPASLNITPESRIVTISWDILIARGVQPSERWSISLYGDKHLSLCTMSVDPGGQIFYWAEGYAEPTQTKLPAETWNHMVLRMDYKMRTAACFLNGQPLMVNGKPMYNEEMPALKYMVLRGFAVRVEGAGSDAAMIDNLSITVAAADCYANCDGSQSMPILNVNDFICFQSAYAAASALPPDEQINSYANCDHSVIKPVLNVNDFVCFMNQFAAACP